MRLPKLVTTSALLLLLLPAAIHAEDDSAFFKQTIQPLLTDNCFRCHGPDKQKAHLRLDSRDAILTGGKHGAAAVPGKPDDSLLIKAVKYTDDDLQMPPRKQLSDEQVAALVDWVKRGLPWASADVKATDGSMSPPPPAPAPTPPGAPSPAPQPTH